MKSFACILAFCISSALIGQIDFSYCAMSKDKKAITILFCLEEGWESGYVSYASGNGIINIESAGYELDFQPEGRPGAFDYFFDECIDGVITGRYSIYIQGANIYSFRYENYRNGQKFDFEETHHDSFCHCQGLR